MQNEIAKENVDATIEKIIKKVDYFFGDRVNISEYDPEYDYPRVSFRISVNLYNYLDSFLIYNFGKISFYICGPNSSNKIFKVPYSEETFDELVRRMDDEARLRIPDKYLIEKGWF
ncbi:MAG TPA: hypothetical protein VK062_05255 [Burkholderiaceae bacterium]|nr:hypothetical protein [Burkholderiaceae bacterium]